MLTYCKEKNIFGFRNQYYLLTLKEFITNMNLKGNITFGFNGYIKQLCFSDDPCNVGEYGEKDVAWFGSSGMRGRRWNTLLIREKEYKKSKN